MQTELSRAKGLTEVRDQGGALLGHFLPKMSPDELRLYLKVLAEYDPAESERQWQAEQKLYSTPEVLQHLQSLRRD
jgi:hypothetical protein